MCQRAVPIQQATDSQAGGESGPCQKCQKSCFRVIQKSLFQTIVGIDAAIAKLIQMAIVRKFIVCPLSAAIMGLWPRPGNPPQMAGFPCRCQGRPLS